MIDVLVSSSLMQSCSEKMIPTSGQAKASGIVTVYIPIYLRWFCVSTSYSSPLKTCAGLKNKLWYHSAKGI